MRCCQVENLHRTATGTAAKGHAEMPLRQPCRIDPPFKDHVASCVTLLESDKPLESITLPLTSITNSLVKIHIPSTKHCAKSCHPGPRYHGYDTKKLFANRELGFQHLQPPHQLAKVAMFFARGLHVRGNYPDHPILDNDNVRARTQWRRHGNTKKTKTRVENRVCVPQPQRLSSGRRRATLSQKGSTYFSLIGRVRECNLCFVQARSFQRHV